MGRTAAWGIPIPTQLQQHKNDKRTADGRECKGAGTGSRDSKMQQQQQVQQEVGRHCKWKDDLADQRSYL